MPEAATGAILYVSLQSVNPMPPYASWATAARTIQEAVDTAAYGDTVLVTNGVYRTGGRAGEGIALSNRVFIAAPITVRSVNGPLATIIRGRPGAGGGNGPGATRCAYVSAGGVLSGFTLTDGHTLTDHWSEAGGGGGAYCSGDGVLTNCIIIGNTAFYGGGGVSGGVVLGCTLANNTADWFGGGAQAATLVECALFSNQAGSDGGGGYDCRMTRCSVDGNLAGSGGGGVAYCPEIEDCWLTSNECVYGGGGAFSSTLLGCVIEGNVAQYAGGAYGGRLRNCAVRGNQAAYDGGGTHTAVVINSVLTANRAGRDGGGAAYGDFRHCTITGNQARDQGGGVFAASAVNSVVYYNTSRAGANHSESAFTACCTTPLPPEGTFNFTDDPLLASPTHLASNSPCIGRGLIGYAEGTDVDGEPWATPPCVGADQYIPGEADSVLWVSIGAQYLRFAAGFPVAFEARIEGQATSSRWQWGDGAETWNRPLGASHAWATPGEYTITLTAYNDAHPQGVSASLSVAVLERPIAYVNASNPTPAYPYQSWATAARLLQEAIDADTLPGRLVLVTNGIYGEGGNTSEGGSLLNRVCLTSAVEVRSINGPEHTVIVGAAGLAGTNGAGAVRCAYLGAGSVLSGFALTNGFTLTNGAAGLDQSGGGAYAELGAILTNCVIAGNSAARDGGGVDGGTLLRCRVASNTAADDAGGVDEAVLVDCELTGNTAGQNAGGADQSTLVRCRVTDNTARWGGGVDDSLLTNCWVMNNHAGESGGAGTDSTLVGCVLNGNRAGIRGGATESSSLIHCTVTGNDAGEEAGGIWQGRAVNSIVYYNRAPASPNHRGTTLDWCCVWPAPSSGTGNLIQDPRLASFSHLAAGSPCLGSGSSNIVAGVDIDGEPWRMPPSLGADEWIQGQVTGALTAGIWMAYSEIAPGFPLDCRALIEGRTTASVWDFGGGLTVSNQPYATAPGWSTPGLHTIRLTAYNETHPQGVSVTATVRVTQAVQYVNAANPNPQFPYASWAAAATNIQDAVAANTVPGRLVLVTNGIYNSGSTRVGTNVLYNRVALTDPVVVQSVNGPEWTWIVGAPEVSLGEAVRCAYVGARAVLSGFTLTNGSTLSLDPYGNQNLRGGGAWAEPEGILTNCIITGNTAWNDGGGVWGGTLLRCTLRNNVAQSDGGGARSARLMDCLLAENQGRFRGGAAMDCFLSHCLLTNNTAWRGGGAHDCEVVQSTIAFNRASGDGGGVHSSIVSSSLLGWNLGARGGGAYLSTLYNTLVVSNACWHDGGGADESTLYNCLVLGNSANDDGGGADESWLYNCTVVNNSAGSRAGGGDECWFYNSIIYYNYARTAPNHYGARAAQYSCTAPLPGSHTACFTNAPGLINWPAGDCRLRSDSPCIDRGTLYVSIPLTNDLDGQWRLLDGNGDSVPQVDLGAYEFDLRSIVPAGWLTRYGLDPNDPWVLSQDPDRDRLTTYGEFIADTDPTNPASLFAIESVVPGPPTLVVFRGSTNRFYTLIRATDLAGGLWQALPEQSNVPGQPLMTLQDTNIPAPSLYYRVKVSQNP